MASALFGADVALDAAQHVGRVVDAVAGEPSSRSITVSRSRQVYMNRVSKPGFVRGHAQPEQMAVDALQLGHQLADRLRARRHFDAGQLLHAQAVGHGVDVRADAADALQQVQVLHPVAALGGLLDPAVDIAQPHDASVTISPSTREFRSARLFQRRVLRPDRAR